MCLDAPSERKPAQATQVALIIYADIRELMQLEESFANASVPLAAEKTPHAHQHASHRHSKKGALEAYSSFESTRDIPIPRNPLEQIIGQDEAVKIAFLAARQRRNLMLVGPPGTGKSLLAQAVSYHLPRPTQEINVLANPENPERPVVEVRTRAEIEEEQKLLKQMKGRLIAPKEAPSFVAERLGFRCRHCNYMSTARQSVCPNCSSDKFLRDQSYSPFGDLLGPYFDAPYRQERVHTTKLEGGREEVVIYERSGEQVRVLDQPLLEKLESVKKKTPRKTIVPLSRKNFVVATGASETELLGDVRHDPYGGHPGLGTPPYMRVLPGAVHEAHEGVLFIDEISALAYIQRFLLTAMQERKYSIVGRNPHSAGASVKVEEVPCDFVLIAASNINDLQHVLPPLRSRILGNGYEVLLETAMPDNLQNRAKLAQFIAQEIAKDKKIPPAERGAVEAVIDEARRRAASVDKHDNALTLRLRELRGIILLAGDIARSEEKQSISHHDVALAIRRGKNIEQQLQDRYGSLYKASQGDTGSANESHREGKEIS